MPRFTYNNISFDSELELNYYQHLKVNNTKFIYQNEYKNIPIKINIGRRKTYTPDFIVFENNTITIVELKGYAKWSANEDNNIMDFMKNKVETDIDFLIKWLSSLNINTNNKVIDYKRLKFLKSVGFVDYDYKNPNSLLNQKRNKIVELEIELKELKSYKKNCERYFDYIKKNKLTNKQIEWKNNFEKEKGIK